MRSTNGTYKQVDPQPRYHAREAAREYARLTGATLLYGQRHAGCRHSVPTARRPANSNGLTAGAGRGSTNRRTDGGASAPRIIDDRRYARGASDGQSEHLSAGRWGERSVHQLGRGEQSILFVNQRGCAIHAVPGVRARTTLSGVEFGDEPGRGWYRPRAPSLPPLRARTPLQDGCPILRKRKIQALWCRDAAGGSRSAEGVPAGTRGTVGRRHGAGSEEVPTSASCRRWRREIDILVGNAAAGERTRSAADDGRRCGGRRRWAQPAGDSRARTGVPAAVAGFGASRTAGTGEDQCLSRHTNRERRDTWRRRRMTTIRSMSTKSHTVGERGIRRLAAWCVSCTRGRDRTGSIERGDAGRCRPADGTRRHGSIGA